MLKENRISHNHNIGGITTGLFFGSMIGALTMLLLAPQSGKRTRAQIKQKGLELIDETEEKVEDAVSQVKMEGRRLAKKGRHRANLLIHQGQDTLSDQFSRVPEMVRAGRKAILHS